MQFTVQQFNDESTWLQERRKGIGASEALAAIGGDETVSRTDLWLDKVGLGKKDSAGKNARWGHLLEPVVRGAFVEESGLDVQHFGRFNQAVSRFRPWLRCSLDGFGKELGGEEFVLECKAFDKFAKAQFEDAIPPAIMVQVHHAMLVTNTSVAWLAVLFGGNDLERYRIPLNQKLAESVIDRETEFWRFVEQQEPPPSSSVEDRLKLVKAVIPQQGKVVELPEDIMVAMATEWRLLMDQEKAAKAVVEAIEEKRNNLRARLGELMGDAEEAIGGNERFTFKVTSNKGYTVPPYTYRAAKLATRKEK